MTYYATVDIGASSGRVSLAWLEDGLFRQETVYRFDNFLVRADEALCWDLTRLFIELKTGLRRCAESGRCPSFVGIDTWGVDFVLLDRENRPVGKPVSYRDGRTAGMDEVVEKIIPGRELYRRTGIQKQLFNTIYQLAAVTRADLAAAGRFLMIPEYLSFLLTGRALNEYTICSTTGLMNATQRDWDYDLIEKLGLPQRLFKKPLPAGSISGRFTPAVREELGFDCTVVLTAMHDTASAVLAAGLAMGGASSIYLSSGTWSLMGIEAAQPVLTEEARRLGFTNEGGFGGTYRLLANIMGLWLLQQIKKDYHYYSFDELAAFAESALDFPSRIAVNDPAFTAPESMTQAVQRHCSARGLPVPESPGEICAVVYQSLAESYAAHAEKIARLQPQNLYDRIVIIGGGSRDKLLNRLTAEKSRLTVYAGIPEATSVGNAAAQMLATGGFSGLDEARVVLGKSFTFDKYMNDQ